MAEYVLPIVGIVVSLGFLAMTSTAGPSRTISGSGSGTGSNYGFGSGSTYNQNPGYGSSGYGSSGYGSSGYGSPGYGSSGYGSSGYTRNYGGKNNKTKFKNKIKKSSTSKNKK